MQKTTCCGWRCTSKTLSSQGNTKGPQYTKCVQGSRGRWSFHWSTSSPTAAVSWDSAWASALSALLSWSSSSLRSCGEMPSKNRSYLFLDIFVPFGLFKFNSFAKVYSIHYTLFLCWSENFSLITAPNSLHSGWSAWHCVKGEGSGCQLWIYLGHKEW